MKKEQEIGSTLDSFLEEEGILEEVRMKVLKSTIAYQVESSYAKATEDKQEMKKGKN